MGPVCWKCGTALDLPSGPVSFRASCTQCGSWLHACINCKNFRPRSGMPNECAVPGTDFVADRQGSNFCEDFSLLGKKVDKGDPSADKGRFDSLFKG